MKVFCILSDERAAQLKSPAIFSSVLKRQGIKGTYVPFMVKPQDLGQAIQSLRILHVAGANITVPYKEATIPYLDVLSEGANIIGAVNTIVRDGDRLKGYNTTAIGIMDALSEAAFEVEGKRALVFGSGGAARAVVFILNWLRASKIYVSGRNSDQARSISTTFSGEVLELSSLPGRSLPVDIVVNATSVSSSEESPEMAEGKGIHFMDGLSALAFQARRTFALWTGLQVPPEEFIRALKETGT